MKKKILNIITVGLIALSSCLGSIYPTYQPIVKAETMTTTAPDENSTSSNEIIIIEGEIEINANQHLQKDKQHVDLTVTAHSDDPQIRIHSIRAPDGTVIEGDEIIYSAPCNGTYEFEVYYEKESKEYNQLHYEYVFDSESMTDGKSPSKANGWLGSSDIMMMSAASGTIYTKLYPYNVTVDDQKMGPGNLHYVAYMQDAEGESIMCMDPEASAGSDFNEYRVDEITSGNYLVRGKNIDVPQSELAEIWFYAQIMGQKISGLSYSVDEWTFICQIMLWSKLGYTISGYDSSFQQGINWVNAQIGQHATYKSLNGEAKQLEVWVNNPWPEGTETLDAGRYVNKDGKVNTSGSWVAYNPDMTVLSFGDPKYIWGNDYKINTEEQDQDGTKVTVITSITGGKISVRNKQNIADQYYPLYNKSTSNISIVYDKSDGFIRYDFARKSGLKDVETIRMSTSQEQFTGTSYSYGAANLQRIMQFKMPEDDIIQFSLPFSEKPNAEVVPPQEQPKELNAPVFIKQDSEDGFPVQGATFAFYAGQTYQIHFQQHRAVIDTPAYCEGSGEDRVCYDATYKWGDWTNGPTQTVWSNGTKIFEEITPADGKIDTSPIINAYYEKAQEVIDTQLAKNTDCEAGGIEYQQHELYLDKEGMGWIGGQFFAMEPDTSQNTCNDTANGACKTDYDGYLNLSPWEKVRFEIGMNVAADAEVIHDNDRQKGRFTVHKIDAESSYLNHNNHHESQGDGYFYGSIFLVTAREDIVLHDGSIATSVFTGNPLTKGEIADVLVLQLPLNKDGTYNYTYLDNLSSSTTQMLDLGEYAAQEIRLPGVYKEDLPLIYDNKDKLWHVNPAASAAVIEKLKDKTSAYYQFDYEKATDLYQNQILPVNSPDGGYWYKDYSNGITNTTNAAFTGGQMINIDIKYVGQDKAYNEVIPDHTKTVGNVIVNEEEVSQRIPDENTSITRGDAYEFTVNTALDYANSIQKGHLQLQKRISDVPDDNGQPSSIGNMNVSDVYFAIYLNNKSDQQLVEPLPDKYFAQQRLDGRVYTFDTNGNFYRDAKDNILFSEDGEIVTELKGWINPTKTVSESSDITAKNLNQKDLYMVLKTNKLGQAGTNIPETIIYANKAVTANTGTTGSYGDYDYANPNKLLASGLPLPYGTYTVLELNAYEGYYPVSYQVTISRDTTDINGIVTELGIETGNQAEDTLRKQFWIFSDRMVESTIKDDLIRQNIEVTKRDFETGKVIPASNTNFMIWQWNETFELKNANKRMEWIKDKLVTDADGKYVCVDEYVANGLACTYADGSPIDAAVKKVELPTYNEATSAQRDAGEYQHWYIYYVEYEQVQDNPGMIGGSTHTVVHRYDATNDFEQKREKDGKILTGKVGNWVSRTYTEPDQYGKTTRTVYATNIEGQFTLPAGDPLIYGEYLLCEIAAPYGYTISSTPTLFKVEHDGSSVKPNAPIELVTIQLDQPNMPQKAAVNVIKKGEVLQGFVRYTTLLDEDAWKPVYQIDQVSDVTTFEIYAEKDIIVNNDVKYTAGSLVDTIMTDQYGNGSSKELYLGKYYMKEKAAPEGYLTDGTPMYFELTYQGQNVSVYPIYKEQTNTRQNLQIKVLKRLSNGQQANDVYFGVYSAEPIKLKEPIKITTPAVDSDDWYDGDYGFTHPNNPDPDNLIITSEIPTFTSETDFEFSNGEITNYTGSETNVVVPVTIGNVAVTAIGDNAFDGKGLTSIVLPSSIEMIGAEALANNDLSSIEFFNYDYADGLAQINLTINTSWTNYNPLLQKIIVPVGTKTVFDQLIDGDEDDCMEYITLVEKQVEDDLGFGRPSIHESIKKLNTLPAGTLLEVIKITNGQGLSQLDYPEGKYYLVEMQVPEGVKIDDETMYEVEFEFDAAAGNTQIITINNGRPIINQTTDKPNEPGHPTPSGSKKTIILDIDTKKSLEQDLLYGNKQAYKEVQFGVYAAEDLYDGKKLIYTKDQLVFQSSIDASGDFLNVMSSENMEIPEGNYYVQEIKTSDDYILDDTKYPFTFDQEKGVYYYTIDLTGHTMVNELKRTHIIVYKVDRQDENKVLAHAEFTLFDKNMNVLEVQVTGDDGIARFSDLPDGRYYVQETATPPGYTPSNEIKEVNILGAETLESKDNEYVIRWTNVLLPAFGEEVETGVDRHIEIAISAAISSLVVLISIAIWTTKRKVR